MENFIATVIIAFVIILGCLFFLGISWFLTGKSRIKLGMCGRVPTKKRDEVEGCGEEESTCPLCQGEKDKTK